MKASILKTPASVDTRPLLFGKVPMPDTREDEVLVRVTACGVCRTVLHVVEGELPVRLSPIIPGHQIVGRVASVGSQVEDFVLNDRVGIAWLNRTCGNCKYCLSGRENLCERSEFTGWSVNGGYAEYVVVPASFTYRIP